MKDIKERLSELISELWEVPTEERTDEIIAEISKLTPDPSWSNYIYHSEEFVNENESLDVEGVVEKILSFKPIKL